MDIKKKRSTESLKLDRKNKRPKASAGRMYTVTVALPGAILENAQSPELRTYVAGQIARALVIFNVDEVVIFNEFPKKQATEGVFKGATKASDPNVLFARILQYLECPQYLRKYFFPVHPDLKYAGLLNPLDCPHHMRIDDVVPYREGVVLDRPVKEGQGSFVNVGMRKELRMDKHLKAGLRVTVKLDPVEAEQVANKKYVTGKVVSPVTPREEGGIYWGYTVRLAASFSCVFTQCPYQGGYDLTLGTSDKGDPVESLVLQPFRHLLIVFGGLKGLESCLDSDERISESDVRSVFDVYVNTCPNQGSRTIRTEPRSIVRTYPCPYMISLASHSDGSVLTETDLREEAVLISLAALQSKIVKNMWPT